MTVVMKLTRLYERVCCRCANANLYRMVYRYRCNECGDERRYGW